MSLWSRVANLFRGDRLRREIDEELQAHLAEAVAQGRDPAEARRAFGSPLYHREQSRDLRLIPWLDSLRADAVFGWRQLTKKKVTSAAAILSLALGIGASTSAFRLIDALLLRPLPVAHPERLYVVAFESIGADGKLMTYDSSSYPMFTQMRTAVKDRAELVAVSYADRIDVTYGSDQEMEKADWQFVSGSMFGAFGLQPAAGRLLNEKDDVTPGAHPVAVLSYDYWTRRFGQDPKAVGRTFRMGNDIYQIVGVCAKGFTGTETGTLTGIFVPMMMKNPRTLASPNNFWLRTLVELKPGVAPEAVHQELAAIFNAIQQERLKSFPAMPKRQQEKLFQEQRLLLESAAAGRSNLQRDYRRSLTALGILVALVLLIACANVANLMTARAAARTREMALRVSIGAGRWRLVQLVLVESAWLAFLATILATAFAWWSAPLIVNMIDTPGNPAHLVLPADWRVFGFALALAAGVTFLFGLAPALRASAVKPANALRGGEDPHARRRLMYALIAVQVAFCFVVHFVAGLFVATFDHLSKTPTGFSAERILNLEAVTQRPQPPAFWDQVAEHLRSVPGVERVAMTGWPLMSGESAIGYISTGGPPSEIFSDFIVASPGFMETMRIPFIDGRDFRPSEAYPNAAIVNQAFVRQFFNGVDPAGNFFDRVEGGGERIRIQIVGFVRDARSRNNPRLPIRPTVFIPLHAIDAKGASNPVGRATFVVRTSSASPLAMASTLRLEVPRARSEFRVSNIRTQTEIERANTIRERLLAMLALFFAVVALLLAGIGLYGVLDYSVVQRRREIGIRIAIGAQAGEIARRVTADIFSMVLVGAVVGLALGMASVRYIEALVYGVKPTGLGALALPAATILMAAMLAAVPGVLRAVRVDPAATLRAE
jgi:predicted permease